MQPILTAAGLLLASLAAAQPADILIHDAVVHTVNRAQPKARAVAIRGARILAVGDGLAAHRGPATRVIDARGGTVIPGIVDSHAHLAGLGEQLESGDLRNAKNVQEIAKFVQKNAVSRAKTAWITGRNWDQTHWGGRFPTAADLDPAAPHHPVWLTRVDGHAGWANSRALQIAGVTAKTPDPAGGKILRDAAGHPTGILIDAAMALVTAKIPPPSPEQIRSRLAAAARECARLGLTTIHDAWVPRETLAAYRELVRAGDFPLRVYAMIGGPGELWNQYLARGPETGEFLTVRAIKLFADGALGSRGAAMWQPYSDDRGNAGLLLTSREVIENVARQAVEKGFQVCTHAIGDRANRVVLEAYAAALGGANGRRFRIEHAQIVSPPDFKLFKDYSIIASIQAAHATSDMRWAGQRLGPDRMAGAYAWQRFIALGVPLANGSDFPVEPPNPMLGFYASVTRQDLSGQPPGGWMPSQRLTRQQALESWTLGGAYAAFEEKEKGSIEPGKLADLVILDRDIMAVPAAEIPHTKVRMTILGGRVVHQAADGTKGLAAK
jgi:predicted amidohydrolase YtcJ